MSTIAAISTPKGIGGIGVVRISGEEAIEIADRVFKPFDGVSRLSSMKGYTAKYGKVMSNHQLIDDAVALVFKAPHSYTGENVVEISCHGGLYLTREVLRAVLKAGASAAEPGEFTKRAFLNGKIDLSQAEAVMDLISARSRRANIIAFNQKEGAVSKKINEIKNQLLEISAQISVWVDYPEEDVPELQSTHLKETFETIYQKFENMIKNYDICSALKQGIKTSLVGKPNVGKSTIMNLISGFERSIVTDVAGTTRDVVEETVMIGDVPLLLSDTAGIRNTEDTVEKIGVEKARQYLKAADLNIVVLDSSSKLTPEDEEILSLCDPKRTILILNKIDLGSKLDKAKVSTCFSRIVEMSAVNGSGLEKFKEVVEEIVGVTEIDSSQSVISNERQLIILQKVKDIILNAIMELERKITLDAISILLYDAINLLMELTGENVTEEIINKVFSQFCVGK